MRVILIRHGDAMSEQQNPQRPLSDKGRQEALSVAKQLQAQDSFAPKRVYHSGKLRAKETAEVISQACGLTVPFEEQACLKPNSDPQDILTILEASGEDAMVVSHLPLVDYLVAEMLLGVPDQQVVEFHTCTVACLHQQANQEWRLEWILIP